MLTHLPGPGFHGLALDEDNTLSAVTLPRGPSGDIVRLGSKPTLLLSSDVPIAIEPDEWSPTGIALSGSDVHVVEFLAAAQTIGAR